MGFDPRPLALSLVLMTGVASAAPSAADKETARALMHEGVALRKSGDERAALAKFEAAHRIMNVPTTGLHVGKSQSALGLLVEARETYLAVTRLPVEPNEPAPFVAARAEAATLAAELAPRIPSLTVVLTGDASRAAVTVDGVSVPTDIVSVPRKLNPGAHVIVVAVGSAIERTEVQLAEGESRSIEIAVPSPSSEPAPPKTTPPAPDRTVAYVTLGVAATGVAVGAITGAMALAKTSSTRDACGGYRCPPPSHDDVDSARLYGNVSTVSFILGGAAGVVSGVLFYMSRRTDVAPVVGLGFVGVRGAF